ncbi:DUF1439 domain-containing protein [Burkholderia ambifaria]|uniref:Uncharacterized protein n=1 Tax=Burkholderia ambifaria (strain ATCC BAA-244 / DSM 16087 / CCUG 44356 / LMG 19182 / AMMD) TaxID=339670 RepID=Q0BHM1_BURCM|nr:DUF1439 domain-containing protein [Burkholderia ambifaria]ABI86352.1 conserved hypothetical protein [Burkholderia ambifaria AMMD]AJY22457.1 hypothetical protein CH72_762 [Burkholderia ambifaria AMMD]ELK6207373.1 DUF1439 domain-containing protein [Burkholderia ambifaria]MBR7934416.1 DUF1439 domain-containing protein [Burkholderia ambifaria]MBR8182734.1 DUF1439 domain-containing protein [Burkholderia ambifaria]
MTASCTPGRRRFLAVCAGAIGVSVSLAVSLAACASTFPFIPDHYTFSRGDVQKAVARKFPYQKTVAQVVDVSLANPAVNLLPDQNRVAVQLDAHFASPFLSEPVSGKFTVSGQLAYDAPSRSVVLRAPAVDSLVLDGNAQMYAQQVGAAAGLLATQVLTNYPIYTFKPEQLQFAGVNYEPGTITILTNGIRVAIVEK